MTKKVREVVKVLIAHFHVKISLIITHAWILTKTITKPFFKPLYFFICDQKVQENRVQVWNFLVKSEYCMLCFCCYFFDYQKICADFSKEIFDTVNWLG